MTIADLRLREFLIQLQEHEKLTTSEILQLLDQQKKYFMKVKKNDDNS